MTVSPKIRVGAIAVLLLAIVALYVSIRHADTVARLIALVATAQDEALGDHFQSVRKLHDLARVVPELRAELERAKKAGTKPIAAVRVRSGLTEFHEPDRSVGMPPDGPQRAGEPTLQAPPLLVSGETQGAIVGLADGSIQQTWKMFATLKRGEWAETRELDDVAADVAIDPAIERAWKSAMGPPSYRLDAWIGASLGLDGVGIAGGASGGRGRFGWWAAGDYILANPERSRVSAGTKIIVKR